METTTDDRVLVVGAGIAGLALTRALRRKGIPVDLTERGRDAGAGGLAINLPGNAVAALTALGLGDGLAGLGRPVTRREYRNATGRLLFAVDEDGFWGPDARPRCVLRSDLHTLLADGLDVTPSRRAVRSLRPATTSSGLSPAGSSPAGSSPVGSSSASSSPADSSPAGADGRFEVRFDDGETRRYGFVAGADGIHSAVRASLFGTTGVREAVLGSASWRFMAPDPGIDCWTAWSGPAGSVLLLPTGDGQVYGYASATRGGPAGAGPSWLTTTFAGYPEPVRTVLDSLRDHPESLYHSPVEEIRLPSWTTGRCALLGDAAHATAPVWAEGAALAVEDALVLADTLATGDWDTAGRRYERRRRPRVQHVQSHTDRFSRTAALPSRLRDPLLPILGPRSYRAAYGPLRKPVR